MSLATLRSMTPVLAIMIVALLNLNYSVFGNKLACTT